MKGKEFADRSIYRRRVTAAELVSFVVSVAESDLHISAGRELSAPAGKDLAAWGEVELVEL